MDKRLLNRDLLLLKKGRYRKVTWEFNAFRVPSFIKILGAFRLDPRKFSLSDLNLLVPVPGNIYDDAGGGRLKFYHNVYIDQTLKIRDSRLGKFRNIHRGHLTSLHGGSGISNMKGWQWICVMHPTCAKDQSILDLIASVSAFLNTDA